MDVRIDHLGCIALLKNKIKSLEWKQVDFKDPLKMD